MSLRRSIRLACALTLCLGLIAASPAASFSSGSAGGATAAKKKCRKGTKLKKKRCVPVKKKSTTPTATPGVPADGVYTGGDDVAPDDVKVTVSTKAGKRMVQASLTILTTCVPSVGHQAVTTPAFDMPLAGTGFTGKSVQNSLFGQTTISGTFVSATRVHVNAQIAGLDPAPGILCSGSADVTADIHQAT